MKLRSALFLMAAAGSLVPSGAGGGSGPSTDTESGENGGDKEGASGAPAVEKPATEKPDTAAKKLRAEWKGKRYAEIAAYHAELYNSGHHDAAAAFHDAVVKTFKDEK